MRSFTDKMYNRRQFAPPVSDTVDVRVLAANTAERHAIPAGATWVLFSADGNFYAKFGGDAVTAAVPAADLTDGSASELNPEAREIPSGAGITSVSLVASAATVITMSWYGA